MTPPAWFLPLARVGFGLGLLAGLYLALTPLPMPPPASGPWDKVEHALGFYLVTVGALIAFPGAARWKLFVGLIGYGALIEALQAIPVLNRSADLADLAADVLGIALALLPTFLRKS